MISFLSCPCLSFVAISSGPEAIHFSIQRSSVLHLSTERTWVRLYSPPQLKVLSSDNGYNLVSVILETIRLSWLRLWVDEEGLAMWIILILSSVLSCLWELNLEPVLYPSHALVLLLLETRLRVLLRLFTGGLWWRISGSYTTLLFLSTLAVPASLLAHFSSCFWSL